MNWFNRLEIIILYGCFLIGFGIHAQEFRKMDFTAIENGLSNSWISCIAQDDKGFIWAGTQDGLHRYDGYRFEVLRNSPEDPRSLAANWARDIVTDSNGDYWIATTGGGLTKFSPKTMDFINFSKPSKNRYAGKYVSKLARLGTRHIASLSDEGLSIFDIATNTHETLDISNLNKIMTSNGSLLWVVHEENQLVRYNQETKTLKHTYTFDSPVQLLKYVPNIGLIVSLPDKLILFKGNGIAKEIIAPEALVAFTSDGNGNHILASASGLFKLDPPSFKLERIKSDLDVTSLKIETIFLDRQGTLWAGTNKGLYKEKNSKKAFLSKAIPLNARRLLKHKGTLYIGGGDGLHSITEKRQKHLIKDVFVTGLVTHGDTVLAAAKNGKVYKFYNEALYKIISLPIAPRKKILCYGLAIDGKQRTWVGSWKGIYVFDKNDELLAFVSLKNLSEKDDAKIIDLHIDSKDRLWITTSAHGIYRVDKFLETDLTDIQSKMVNYKRESENPKSLISNIVMSYEEDDRNQMWFGSDAGVVRYNESTEDFDRLRYQGKLFDQKIMTIRNDGDNNLWITTISNGIYVYNDKKKTMHHFTKKDGLISNAFLFGSGFYDRTEKMMYFGTDDGVQQIDLSKPLDEKKINPPVVTNFKVNTTDVQSTISPYSAPHLKTISLAPDQNDFSVSFSALDFTNPEKLQYAYALDDGAFKIADLQTAYFANVPFGEHRLKVQTLYDGIIQEQGVSCLSIYIKPPWYLGLLAKIIYLLCSCGIIFGIYFYFKWRWRMQLSLKLKEEEAERLQKLNDFKSNLYTDIAHEFKTPLTLISGPIDNALQQGNLSNFNRANISIVQRNTDRLTSLVDQLLELAKLENGKLNMNVSKGDLGLFLQGLSRLFEYQALLKGMNYSVNIARFDEVWYDKDIMEKIVMNLLSNAFKYSPDKGNCSFSVRMDNDRVYLSIKNTALNASKLPLDKLFTRFYQQDTYSDGMGVGLSLVKELTKAYGGAISATLEQDDTLHFQLELPVGRTAFAEEMIQEFNRSTEQTEKEIDCVEIEQGPSKKGIKDRPLLLIVEDYEEIRAFVKLALQNDYRIIEAENGKSGMEMALAQVPDIILSDVRMPIKNGIELCNAIKNDERTSHIPIILLTASIGEEHELKGLTSGADDYITKPFKVAILQQRIANLIAIRKKLQRRYSQEFILKPKDITITPSDEAFLNKVQKILDEHLSDPEFNSESFSKMANMSRMQLHRKLLAYTGLSTSAFIRSQRLHQAIKVLNSSDLTISEVAYTVGFNTPRYFMKCFKETFKKTPSEYIQTVDYQ